MRVALAAVLVALIAAAPAAGATKVKVGAPHAGTLSVKVSKRARLVATLGGKVIAEPRTVRGRARLPLTRAGQVQLAACAPGRLRVLAYAPRTASQAVGEPIARGRRALKPKCESSVPAPASLDIPGAKGCDQLDAATCLQPFPSDFFTVEDTSMATKRRIDFPAAGMPANVAGVKVATAEYKRNDGFSPGSALITRVPGLDSQEALARTDAVPIDDLARAYDKRQPVVVIDATTGRRWPVWTEVDANPKAAADRNVIIRPAKNFLEGHRYVVALRRMRTADGSIVRASTAFAALRDGTVSTNGELERRRTHFESLFTTLARSGVDRDDLFLAWDFTVASERNLSERMLAMRDDAFEQLGDTNLKDLTVQGAAPKITITKVAENPEEQVLRRVDGTVQVPCYLNSPGCASGGTFNYKSGLPAQQGTQAARFTCNIPRVAADGAPLRAGIYGHGLLGSRGEVNQGQLKTLSQDHGFVFCATDWSGMACTDTPDPPEVPLYLPDCDIPTVATILTDISNFPRLADRVQQGMLNALYLGRVMIHPQGLGANAAFQVNGKSVLDTSRLYYDGNSQGGIIGGALISIAPDLDRGVLGVVGMNYSTLLRRSVDFNTYASVLYASYPDELERPVLLQLLQMLWDRAETNGYAEHITRDPYPNTPVHKVLMHIGLGDHQVTNYAAKVEARTVGARAFAPWAEPGRDTDKDPLFGIPAISGSTYDGSALITMFDSGSPVPPKTEIPPSEGEDPHELPRRSPLAQQQKSDFLRPDGIFKDVCGTSPCFAGSKAP